MKKILTLSLCLAVLGSAGAQKAVVDNAKKLSGKLDKIGEARTLINEAIANPETGNQANTYFIAGNIEFDAFDKQKTQKLVDPNSVNPVDMGNELLAGYDFYMKALPLDSLPNEKGQIKPAVSKNIIGKLSSHAEDFFGAGADFFNAKDYSNAYRAFEIFGDLATSPLLGKLTATFNPELVANAFFNAGLSAYSANMVDQSAEAFKKAREAGYDQPESYIYEIACWQNIAQNENRLQEAQNNIMEAALAGFDKFGIEQPVFLNNIINTYVMDENFDQAFATIDPLIDANPQSAALYGLRGFVYDRAGNDDASEADYRKAASLPDVDFETLKNVGKKLFKLGTIKLNEIEGNSPEAAAAREAVKQNYFIAAQEIVEKAGQMNPNDDELQNLADGIDYSLTTYF